MRVSIYGAGYVGLVTSACLAEMGNDVLCVDVNEERIAQLKGGNCPIHEPGLEQLIRDNLSANRLRFSTDLLEANEHACLQMIAVGTPSGDDGSADVSHVLKVCEHIGRHMNEPKVIVEKSTVPVGTAAAIRGRVQNILLERGESIEFHVVSNPEFLKEGAAVEDFMRPDRIIVGADNSFAVQLIKDLYAPFNRSRDKLIVMDPASSELTKYAANVMLATKISLMNEFANIAEGVGADIEQVRKGIGSDPRIGYQFIYPGCGFGGSCFPKDIRALEKIAEHAQVDPMLTRAVRVVNEQQKRMLFRKINQFYAGNLQGKRIAVWGLSFKPNTDDLREAPSLTLIESLIEAGALVQGYDPMATAGASCFKSEGFTRSENPLDALRGAHALAICTEWNEFRSPDFAEMRRRMERPLIFDGRNLYDPMVMPQHGFQYFGVGRAAE